MAEEREMIVMGLMQNTWARDPVRVTKMLCRNPELRNVLIAQLLFAGCMSGRRLRTAFGPLCDDIVWENATPVVTSSPNAKVAGDADHLRASLAYVKPDVVLAFGKVARDTITAAAYEGVVIPGPNPVARTGGIDARLNLMRLSLATVARASRTGENVR